MALLLEARKLRRTYESKPVLSDVSIEVAQGETVVLLGPSGSGKTTLLRIIAGFLAPDDGDVLLNGKTASAAGKILVAPQDRRIGMVFQDLALWPHLNVLEHIRLPFAARGQNGAQPKAELLIEMLGLKGQEKRYPAQLSGGQQQLVSFGRALAGDPILVLFDEPFSSLDVLKKKPLLDEIRALRKKVETGFIYVTHDHREAFSLASRLCILNEGQVLQEGTPEKILSAPQHGFVKDFLQAGGVL